MPASTRTTTRKLKATDLRAAGLTAQQVARLIEARRRYTSLHEYFSDRELQHLLFLRWQVERGRITRG